MGAPQWDVTVGVRLRLRAASPKAAEERVTRWVRNLADNSSVDLIDATSMVVTAATNQEKEDTTMWDDADFASDDPLVRFNAHQAARGRSPMPDPDLERGSGSREQGTDICGCSWRLAPADHPYPACPHDIRGPSGASGAA